MESFWVLVDGIQTRDGNVTYLKRFVEEEAEIGENDPQFLPAIAVFEFAQQVTAQLVLSK